MEAPRVSKRKQTVLTLETDSSYSGKKELDKGLSQRLVGER